jgi:gamma-glutamylputrescine oxidase
MHAVTLPRDEVLWQVGQQPIATRLAADTSADVAVVGGGVAGLTCALALVARGRRVVLLERAFCGSGASGKSSGFVTPDSEMQLSDLVATYGAARGAALWRLVETGVELIRDNIHELAIDCDYEVQDSLLAGVGARGAEHVQAEHEVRLRLGYESAHVRGSGVEEMLGTQRYTGAVRYAGSFGMDSYRYCRGLRDAVIARGAAVYEEAEVTGISSSGVSVGPHQVRADHVVVCTDRFAPALGVLVDEVDQVQTFLAVSKPLPESSITRMFPAGRLLVWDTDVIYHYFRIVAGSRLLVGGADLLRTYARHERHEPQKSLGQLRSYIGTVFPFLQVTWEFVWPGMLGVTKDFLPIAGRDRRHRNIHYIAAATGLPWASALGHSISQDICGEAVELPPELSPYRRFSLDRMWHDVLTKPLSFAVSHGMRKANQRYFQG